MIGAWAYRTIVRFPKERVRHGVRSGATFFDIWRTRGRTWLGRLLNRASMPGAIKPMKITDKLTGQHIAVSVGELFVCVSVDSRDYYFDRLTGRFDGTGSSPN